MAPATIDTKQDGTEMNALHHWLVWEVVVYLSLAGL